VSLTRPEGCTRSAASVSTDASISSIAGFKTASKRSPAALPWDLYVAALRPQGKLCIVGIPDQPIAVQPFNLIGGEKSIVGGQPGSIVEMRQMLAFSARHGIKPMIETFPMADANRALEHTRSGKARFRAVLVA